MNTVERIELEERIHNFLDRKTRQFPELERVVAKKERPDVRTRVHDFVAHWPQAHPRHSH